MGQLEVLVAELLAVDGLSTGALLRVSELSCGREASYGRELSCDSDREVSYGRECRLYLRCPG